MVYDDGISVGRHRRRSGRPEKSYRASVTGTVVSDGGMTFLAVANAEQLDEGEILRADVNGTIIALAKVGGQFYAFQEFCTHRYGPLSEGALNGTDIECPWHRSCFDIRSGRVKKGPAKVDLKTYPVKMVNGKILIGVSPFSPVT